MSQNEVANILCRNPSLLRPAHQGMSLAALMAMGRPPLSSQATGNLAAAQVGQALGEIEAQQIRQALNAAARGDLAAQMKLFSAMEDRDARLGSNLALRRKVAASLPVQVLPADLPDHASEADRQLAEEIAGQFEELLTRVWTRLAREEMYDAIGKEASLMDIEWVVRRDGRVDIEQLTYIEPECLRYAEGEFRIITESNRQGESLTPDRYLLHIHPAKPGRPGTRGLLRPCAAMWLLKNHGWKGWAIFTEIFGSPLRTAEVPRNADDNERSKVEQMLEQLGTAAWGSFTEGTKIDFHEVSKGAKGSTPYEAMISFATEEMTIAVLGQTLTTSVGDGGGAYALGDIHNQVRGDLRDSDAWLGCGTARRCLAVPWTRFNHGREDLAPKVEPLVEEAEDLLQLKDVYRTLIVDLGLPVSKAHIYERFGVPEPEPGEGLVSPPVAAQGGGPMQLPFDRASALVAADDLAALSAAPRRGPAEAVAEQADREARRRHIDPARQVLALVERPATGTALTELAANLSATTPEPDPKLADLLAQAILVADLEGRRNWANRLKRKGLSLVVARDAVRMVALAGDGAIKIGSFPFDEAVEALRKRVAMPREAFDLLVAEARKRAFTASGLSSQRALEILKGLVEQSLREGIPFGDFRRLLKTRLAEAGLSSQRPTHLQLVFRQSTMQSYAAGQWKQMADTKRDFPYWQYVATRDSETRPEHRALQGKVFSVDDPAAAAYFPPWDYNCRCDAIPMTAAEVAERGLRVENGYDVRRQRVAVGTATVSMAPKPEFDAPPDGRAVA